MTAREAPRIAIVTGAAKRVGRAIASSLAGDGWDICVHHGASAEAARQLVTEIEATGRRASAVAADLGDAGAAAKVVSACTAALGAPTLLVNNASLFLYDDLGTLTAEQWDRHLDVNLKAPVFLAKAFAASLPAGAEGNVVNIIDQRVWKPTPQFLSYSIAKAGLWEATRMLAQALAPRIRVNAIGPGPVLQSVHQTAEQFARQAGATLLERSTSPEEIAAAIRFIVAAPAMTGQMIALDGGQHLAWQTRDVVDAETPSAGPSAAAMDRGPRGARRIVSPNGRRRVLVDTLEIRTVIGIYPHEKLTPQRVLVSLDLDVLETGEPGSDRFEDVVDYERLVVDIRRIATQGGVVLVETLAERIAAACLADPRVILARVKVVKPDVFDDAAGVGVEIERSARPT